MSSVARFQHDVSDPDNIEAEALIYTYLKRHFTDVRDCRDQYTAWDFTFWRDGRVKRLDVKRDKYIETTRRFPFEVCDEYLDGSRRATWGCHRELDYIAAVGQSLHRAYIASLPDIRDFVLWKMTLKHMDNWKEFHQNNGHYVTHGVAVPIAELTDAGVKVAEVVIGVKQVQ